MSINSKKMGLISLSSTATHSMKMFLHFQRAENL